jgi:outer membrane immunogenic protein
MTKFSVAFYVATAAACFCVPPAAAGDLFYPTNYRWSGVYLGGEIGGFWSDIDGKFTTGAPASWNSGPTGGIGGGIVGYQQEFGTIILGVEGNYLDSFNSDGSDRCHPSSSCDPGDRHFGHIGEIWTVGGRVGWNGGQFMPFASGGYANASVANDFEDSLGVTNAASEDRLDGWYVGGGVDMAISGSWKIGVEYRHYEFDTITTTPSAGGAPVPIDRWTLDPSADTVTARLSILFGRDREQAPIPLK